MNLKLLLTEENCRSVRARTWSKLSAIFALSERVVEIIRELTHRDYRSSYADAQLASAYMTIWAGCDDPTDEQIVQMLAKYYALQPVDEHRDDAQDAVNKIMDTMIEIIHDDGREKLSISECLNRMYRKTYENEDGMTIAYKSDHLRNYKLMLSRHGVVMRHDYSVAFHNGSEFIKKITGYESGYGRMLQRHPGFVRNADKGKNQFQVHFPHDGKPQWCSVIQGLIEIKDEDAQGVMV